MLDRKQISQLRHTVMANGGKIALIRATMSVLDQRLDQISAKLAKRECRSPRSSRGGA